MDQNDTIQAPQDKSEPLLVKEEQESSFANQSVEITPTPSAKIAKILLKDALPLTFSFFVTTFASMTSYNFLKESDGSELIIGAYGVGGSFLNIAVFSVIVSLNYGLLTKLSQARGAENYRLMGLYFHRGIIINLIILVFLSILIAFSANILKGVGYDATRADQIRTFLLWSLPAMFLYTTYSTFNYYLNANKMYAQSAVMQFVAIPSYILSSYLLVKVAGLGLQGAALASCVMYGLLAIMTVSFTFKKQANSPSFFRPEKESFKGLFELFKYEVLIGSMVFAEWVGTEIIALSIGRLDSDQYAAYPVTTSLVMLPNNYTLALTNTVTSNIGAAMGANNIRKAKRVMRTGIFLALAGAALVFFVYFFSIEDIASLMLPTQTAIDDSAKMMHIYLIFVAVDYTQAVMASTIRAVDRKIEGFFVAILSVYVVAMPLAFGLCFGAGLGMFGLAWGTYSGLCVALVAYLFFYFRTDWKKQAAKIIKSVQKAKE